MYSVPMNGWNFFFPGRKLMFLFNVGCKIPIISRKFENQQYLAPLLKMGPLRALKIIACAFYLAIPSNWTHQGCPDWRLC